MASLPRAGELEFNDLSSPFPAKPFCHSVKEERRRSQSEVAAVGCGSAPVGGLSGGLL